jgi:hypothetical protein
MDIDDDDIVDSMSEAGGKTKRVKDVNNEAGKTQSNWGGGFEAMNNKDGE